jgi:hypothetical protein
MKKLIAVAIVATSLIGSQSAQGAPAASTTFVLTTHATGSAVTMPSNMKMGGAKTGSADARFVIDLKKNTLCYTVTTMGLTGIAEAHIHTGAVGVDGADVIPFLPAKFNKKAPTCIKSTPALLGMIATTPANYYFNVHTKKYPDGAVRGQLAAGM